MPRLSLSQFITVPSGASDSILFPASDTIRPFVKLRYYLMMAEKCHVFPIVERFITVTLYNRRGVPAMDYVKIFASEYSLSAHGSRFTERLGVADRESGPVIKPLDGIK